MKVSVPGADDASRALITSWGYEVVELEAHRLRRRGPKRARNSPDGRAGASPLCASSLEDGVPAIGIGIENVADDFINAPLDRAEFDARVRRIVERRQRTIDLVHDLRSPLNAVQGYADLIIEESVGDTQRFANQIRTAAVQMTARLQEIRDKGV